MKLSQDCVFVLDEQEREGHSPRLAHLSGSYSLIVADSADYVVEQAQQLNPCLVILVGENSTWLSSQVRALRQAAPTSPMTIVALTESGSPRWQRTDEVLDLDGFLVQPLTDDILVSLVQSAMIKQSFSQSDASIGLSV
ncbi:MAG: hypothetical protein AAF609_07355 [Cyanobacteria bacterium P01_C01_bin.120]